MSLSRREDIGLREREGEEGRGREGERVGEEENKERGRSRGHENDGNKVR